MTSRPDPTQFPESRDSLPSTQRRRRYEVASSNGEHEFCEGAVSAVRSLRRRVRSLQIQLATMRRRLHTPPVSRPPAAHS